MSKLPGRPAASVRVAVSRRDGPGELAGQFCMCPRTGRLMRLETCLGCEYVEQFHLAGAGPAFIQCTLDPDAADRPEPADDSSVTEIMTGEVISVDAAMPVERLMLLLVDEDIGGVPVVDDSGRPIGVVSKTDILSELSEDCAEPCCRPDTGTPNELEPERCRADRTAADLMTHPLLAVCTSASISEAAALMTSRRVHRLGVADPTGRLVGMVTMTDIVRWVARR